MEVAELTGIDIGFVGLELSYGLVLGSEVAAQHTFRSDELNPLDVVLRCHGVLNAAHSDAIAAIDLLYYGDVLLLGTVSGILLEKLHRLTAALGGAAAVMKHFYNVTTLLTLIYFSYFCHNVSVLIMFLYSVCKYRD